MKCIAQRLWSKVQPDPLGCWSWTGALNPNGYGYISTSTGMAYWWPVA